jgi:regulatory protein YycH of two-component signal transduction system YycFG
MEILVTQPHFTTTLSVGQTPKEAFDAINQVRRWWPGAIEGRTDQLGAEFIYRYKDVHYSKQKVTELTPGKRVVWRVLESRLNFIEDTNEWKDTEVIFDIARKGDHTEVRFSHVGLVPGIECYGACSNAWGSIINDSLRSLIATGAGKLDLLD